MAVFNVFFHLDRSCTILGAIFHKRRSSVPDSFHDLHGLPQPSQPVRRFGCNVLSSRHFSLQVHTIQDELFLTLILMAEDLIQVIQTYIILSFDLAYPT